MAYEVIELPDVFGRTIVSRSSRDRAGYTLQVYAVHSVYSKSPEFVRDESELVARIQVPPDQWNAFTCDMEQFIRDTATRTGRDAWKEKRPSLAEGDVRIDVLRVQHYCTVQKNESVAEVWVTVPMRRTLRNLFLRKAVRYSAVVHERDLLQFLGT